MHKSALEELVLDNCSFMENITTNKRYNQLAGENDTIYRQLKVMLNTEQLDLLDKLIYNHMGMEAEITECHLIHGFKAGLRLMIECL